jgi:uncharacterized protein YbjT (DUF2867 family)
MKIVVIGGTSLIGSKVVACLDEAEYEALPASPDTGVNTLTGGLSSPTSISSTATWSGRRVSLTAESVVGRSRG